MPTEAFSKIRPSRRALMQLGAGGIGLSGLLVLSACGSNPSSGSTTPHQSGSATPQVSDSASTSSSGASPTGYAVAASSVPVGSGIISGEYVVTQPVANEFKAFDVTCPHQGCPVQRVEDQVITCLCHGSEFSIADGSVEEGPATTGLTPRTVTRNGSDLLVN